jgi:hypothetical protein
VLDELRVRYLARGGRGRRACHVMDGGREWSFYV